MEQYILFWMAYGIILVKNYFVITKINKNMKVYLLVCLSGNDFNYSNRRGHIVNKLLLRMDVTVSTKLTAWDPHFWY